MVNANVRLLRPLGEGGMGRVWVADHLSLHTQVVVKFMAPELAGSAEAVARFSREAAAASRVKSPNVVQILDHGVAEGGAPYIVMELLEGTDLERHLHVHGRLEPLEVCSIVSQLARALTKAHALGIVHRDVKPSNVFLFDPGDGDVFVKLLDFGVAKAPLVSLGGSSTSTGSVIGSPYYMSPEQVVGSKDLDHRTDLWSLGVLAFEALTGVRPFVAETVGALAVKIHQDALPVPSKIQPAIAPEVDAWFARACARDPADRFASARELAAALDQAVTGKASVSDRVRSTLRPIVVSPASGGAAVRGDEPTLPPAESSRVETGAGLGLPVASALGIRPRGGRRWTLAAVAAAGACLVLVGVRLTRPPSVAASSTPSPSTPPVAPLLLEPAVSLAPRAPDPPAPAGDPIPAVAALPKKAAPAAPVPVHAAPVALAPVRAAPVHDAGVHPAGVPASPELDDDIK